VALWFRIASIRLITVGGEAPSGVIPAWGTGVVLDSEPCTNADSVPELATRGLSVSSW